MTCGGGQTIPPRAATDAEAGQGITLTVGEVPCPARCEKIQLSGGESIESTHRQGYVVGIRSGSELSQESGRRLIPEIDFLGLQPLDTGVVSFEGESSTGKERLPRHIPGRCKTSRSWGMENRKAGSNPDYRCGTSCREHLQRRFPFRWMRR